MATYVWRWWFACSREALWPFISDTDRVNKDAGLPAVKYEYEPLVTGGSRTKATVRQGPITIRWYEPPFDWSAPDYYQVERRYLGGPLRWFRNRVELQEKDGGTEVVFTLELQARNKLFAPLIPLLASRTKPGTERAIKIAATKAMKELPKFKEVPPIFGRSQLAAAGFHEDVLDKLALFVATADDRDLAKMRAYDLADRWGEDRKTVLRLFLHATRVGLFNLSWDVLCANCRGTKQSAENLSELRRNVHCDACNVRFGPQFDRSVEVTFNAHPIGRGLNVPQYCLLGPGSGRHVVAQEQVPANSSAELTFSAAPGQYYANAMTVGAVPFSVEETSASHNGSIEIGAQGVTGVPDSIPQHAHFVLKNALPREVLLRVQHSEWPDTIATAADITAMQEFRNLFSSEVLAPGLELGIQAMSVLFTDLVGSTELYSKGGDAPAFRVVNEHFEKMKAVIAQYDGAIVKTIGDAIMAVFRDSGQCLEAALRLPASIGDVQSEIGKLRLRVGFHAGPCIAIRANERLDYFGTTVNLASRLEHEAGAGEVTFADSTARLPHIRDVVAKYGLKPEARELRIRGFSEPIAVLRVRGFDDQGSRGSTNTVAGSV